MSIEEIREFYKGYILAIFDILEEIKDLEPHHYEIMDELIRKAINDLVMDTARYIKSKGKEQ